MLLRMENPKEVRNLIQKEVDINCKDIYGSSPLDEAALHVGQIFLYFFFFFVYNCSNQSSSTTHPGSSSVFPYPPLPKVP